MGRYYHFRPKPTRRGIAARNELVLNYRRLIRWALFKKNPDPDEESGSAAIACKIGSADAAQEAAISLMRAAELWDESKGAFSSYATTCIRKGMLSVPVRKKNLLPLPFENLSERKHSAALAREDSAPTDSADANELTARIEEVLKTLTERERLAVKLRYGIGYDKAHTLLETGKILNITCERVRQVEAKAIRKLQHPFRSNRLCEFIGLSYCIHCEGFASVFAACPVCGVDKCCVSCIRPRRDSELDLAQRSCKQCWEMARSGAANRRQANSQGDRRDDRRFWLRNPMSTDSGLRRST